MAAPLACWKCSGSLAGIVLPIGRRDDCPHCAADLHVCRQCDFYDPNVSKDCREPMADEVADKERGNFCDYFRAGTRTGAQAGGDAEAARAKLAGLFGGSGPGKASALAGEAQAQKGKGESGAQAARRRLEGLLGGKSQKKE